MTEFGPAVPRPGATPLECAHAHLGVQETGPNRGPLIDEWHRRVGIDVNHPDAPEGGYEWCASFACCMVMDGGHELDAYSASVRKLHDRNPDLRVPVGEARPGDLLLRLVPGQTHVAMLSDVTASPLWVTVDGNSNEAGSRRGNAVVRKERPASHWQAALRPRKA